MTELRDHFHAYPQKLKVSTLRPDQSCDRDPLYVAAVGKPTGRIDLPVAWESSADGITVYEGDASETEGAAPELELRPVYRLPPKGPPLVPTGLVFVRFEDGVAVEGRRRDIADAGYDIVSVPPYAPHSAWLKASDGTVSSALSGTGALEELADMVNVEPQLLGPRVPR